MKTGFPSIIRDRLSYRIRSGRGKVRPIASCCSVDPAREERNAAAQTKAITARDTLLICICSRPPPTLNPHEFSPNDLHLAAFIYISRNKIGCRPAHSPNASELRVLRRGRRWLDLRKHDFHSPADPQRTVLDDHPKPSDMPVVLSFTSPADVKLIRCSWLRYASATVSAKNLVFLAIF
jgi:hypothetical protein